MNYMEDWLYHMEDRLHHMENRLRNMDFQPIIIKENILESSHFHLLSYIYNVL